MNSQNPLQPPSMPDLQPPELSDLQPTPVTHTPVAPVQAQPVSEPQVPVTPAQQMQPVTEPQVPATQASYGQPAPGAQTPTPPTPYAQPVPGAQTQAPRYPYGQPAPGAQSQPPRYPYGQPAPEAQSQAPRYPYGQPAPEAQSQAPRYPYGQPVPRPQTPPTPPVFAQPQPKKKKGPSLGVRILLRLMAIVLSLCLFVSLCAGILIYDGMQLLSEDNLQDLLDDLEEEDYKDNEVLLMVQDEMVYWVDAILENEAGIDIQPERDQILSFLEESTISTFLAEKASGYVRDILEDTRKTRVSTRELRNLYEENKQIMEEELDIHISSELNRQILENLEKIDVDAMLQENVFDYLESEDGPNRQMRKLMDLISKVFSGEGLTICCIIIGVLIIALLLCNRLHLPGSLTHSGIPMIFSGLLLMLPALLAGPVLMEIFEETGSAIPTQAQCVLTLLLSKCTSMLTTAPMAVLITGGVFVVAALVLKLIFKKK